MQWQKMREEDKAIEEKVETPRVPTQLCCLAPG